MEEFDYKGYTIEQTTDGYFVIGQYAFYSLDEAMDWIDEQDEVMPTAKKNHKYLFFYVDNATDRSFEVMISAPTYQEAKNKLLLEYDVYHIADWYRVE